MNRFFSLFLALIAWMPSFSQEAKRYVLVEHFTNTRCSICASRNPAFFSAIEPHAEDVHHIAFHPSFPYSSCVFYQHNTEENQDRAVLYSVPGTPQAYLWGTKVSSGSGLLPGNTLPNALNQTSPIAVLVDEELSGFGREASITIQSVGTVPTGGDYRLFVAVVEKLVNYDAPNGEDEHHNVFRDMLPGSAGEPIIFAEQGGEISKAFTYSFSSEWDVNQVYVIAYVQDMNTKEVLNSGSTFDVRPTTSIDRELDSRLSVFPNPATDLIELDWQGIKANQAILSLYSPTGQRVRLATIQATQSRSQLDVSDLPRGIYFLRLDLDGRQAVRKVSVE